MYQISISFGCAPERVDEILKAVYAQIDSLKAVGPEERYVAAIKETLKRRFESVTGKDWYWRREIREALFRDEDPRNILKDPEYAVAFDARSIQDAAKTYFDMGNYIEMIRLPEKGSNE
jgi:zinc protease